MHLDRELDFLLLEESRLFSPVRQDTLVPLPVQNITELVGPGACHPVRIFCVGPVAGASAEAVDAIQTEHRGKLHSVDEDVVVVLGDGLVGVESVAVDAERSQSQAPLLNGVHQAVAFALAF